MSPVEHIPHRLEAVFKDLHSHAMVWRQPCFQKAYHVDMWVSLQSQQGFPFLLVLFWVFHRQKLYRSCVSRTGNCWENLAIPACTQALPPLDLPTKILQCFTSILARWQCEEMHTCVSREFWCNPAGKGMQEGDGPWLFPWNAYYERINQKLLSHKCDIQGFAKS